MARGWQDGDGVAGGEAGRDWREPRMHARLVTTDSDSKCRFQRSQRRAWTGTVAGTAPPLILLLLLLLLLLGHRAVTNPLETF